MFFNLCFWVYDITKWIHYVQWSSKVKLKIQENFHTVDENEDFSTSEYNKKRVTDTAQWRISILRKHCRINDFEMKIWNVNLYLKIWKHTNVSHGEWWLAYSFTYMCSFMYRFIDIECLKIYTAHLCLSDFWIHLNQRYRIQRILMTGTYMCIWLICLIFINKDKRITR